jgi:hypothetical protein
MRIPRTAYLSAEVRLLDARATSAEHRRRKKRATCREVASPDRCLPGIVRPCILHDKSSDSGCFVLGCSSPRLAGVCGPESARKGPPSYGPQYDNRRIAQFPQPDMCRRVSRVRAGNRRRSERNELLNGNPPLGHRRLSSSVLLDGTRVLSRLIEDVGTLALFGRRAREHALR